MAFLEGDAQGIQELLDRGQSDWGNYGEVYPVFEAAVSYLKGDPGGAKETVASLSRNTGYVPFFVKSQIASLEGDLNLALDYYSKALSESEYSAFAFIQVPSLLVRTFPEYRSHPKYQKMLRDVGLDEKSVAKLKILPLPF